MGHLQITGCPSLIIFEIAWRAFFDQTNNPNTLYYGAECGANDAIQDGFLTTDQ